MKDKLILAAFIFLFFGGFFILSIALAVDLARDVVLARESLRWPTTSGTVVDIIGGTQSSKVKIEYRFEVAGKEYMSRRVAHVLSPTQARGTVNGRSYSEGEAVLVYYHPQQPEISVLQPGAPDKYIIGNALIIALVFLIGAGGLWAGLKSLLTRR